MNLQSIPGPVWILSLLNCCFSKWAYYLLLSTALGGLQLIFWGTIQHQWNLTLNFFFSGCKSFLMELVQTRQLDLLLGKPMIYLIKFQLLKTMLFKNIHVSLASYNFISS